MSSNILYICNAMLQNVVIMTDENGKNALDNLLKFKFNQLLLKRSTDNLKRDSVLINDEIHSDCIIIVDEQGNNVLKSRDEISNTNPDENNVFIEVLKQVHVDKEPTNIEEFLLKKRESLQSKLKTATYYFNMKSFIKACDLYKEVLTIIDTDMYPDEFMLKDTDLLAIKFGYALSKMAICKTEELQTAAKILTILNTEHGDNFPTLYYYLARCLFLLEKYEEAKEILNCVENKLKNIEYLSELNWPGSDIKMIVRTEKPLLEENIQTLFKECNEFRLPDVKCFFIRCENKNIFFDSPCFNGYVIVKCSNKCNFTYHKNCWKMKLKADCVKKPSFFLGNLCATADCGGTINEILIYDEKLHLNTFIVPKIVKTDKYEEKNISSNDKAPRKPLSFKESTNEVPKIISDFLPSNENKSHISKKNSETGVKHEYESKKDKKPGFNLNAKEYVPSKKGTLKLNTNAKEYIPPQISTKTNAENEGRENLFDIQNSEQIDTSSINETNKSFVKYSEEDNVSVDFLFDDDSSIKKFKKVPQVTNSKYCQTNITNSVDVTKLNTDLAHLQSQLFRAEEDYNNLLTQNNLLRKKLEESLAKPKKCDNCPKLRDAISQKESENLDALTKLQQLEDNNNDLTSKLKKLENILNVELQEKQAKIENNLNLVHKNEVLQRKNDELLSKMKIMSQQHAYIVQHDNGHLRKVMFDQIGCIRHAYASYFTLYENKSKHMLWELEDIKALSTPETLPTLKEIDENIDAWKSAHDNSIKSRYMMNGFYEHLFRQFSNEQTTCPTPMSFPSLIIEPPNIIVRHFKSLCIVNKRLEKELHEQMNAFYKMISTPYPGVFPQKHPQISNTAITATATSTATATITEENQIIHSVLQNNTSENIPEVCSKTDSSEVLVAHNFNKWDSASIAPLTSSPNMYDNLVKSSTSLGPSSRKITKQSVFKDTSIDDDQNSRKENYPNAAKCDVSSLGTIPKNKSSSQFIEASSSASTSTSTSTSNRNSPMQKATKSKPDVIGPESLVNKLHEKLPLIPVNLISKAVDILREKSGGLTGKDSKQIIAEVKQILKEIAITEKCLRKNRGLPPEKTVKTWKKVNNGVHWNNEDPDVNCTICFEFMEPDKRTKLRCQHIFHTTCIKLWLQNDSICPICRSFATLDDEYPPLK